MAGRRCKESTRHILLLPTGAERGVSLPVHVMHDLLGGGRFVGVPVEVAHRVVLDHHADKLSRLVCGWRGQESALFIASHHLFCGNVPDGAVISIITDLSTTYLIVI